MIKIPRDIRMFFLILLGIFYLILGVFIYLSRKQITTSPWGEILGAAFVIYGGWRIFRALQINKISDTKTE